MANTTKTLKAKGLNVHQIAYWKKRLGANASAGQILKARNKQVANHNPNAYGTIFSTPQGPVGTGLSPVQLNSQVNAAAKLQFGDQQTQLNNQIGQVDPIYNAYATSIFNAQAAAKSAADAANQQITQGAANVETANDTARTQLLQQMQADAAKRGGTVDNSLFANDLQAGAARQAQANSQAALASTLGQNAQTFLTGQGALGEAARAQRKADLGNQKTQLASQIGAFKNTQKQSLIDNARKLGVEMGTLGVSMENANTSSKLASGNLKFKGQSQKESRRHNRATEKNTANNPSRQKTQLEINYFRKHGYFPSTKSKGGGKNGSGPSDLTPTQKRSYQQKYQNAQALAHEIEGTKTGRNMDASQEIDFLVTKGIPKDLAAAAVYGRVNQKAAKRILTTYGVKVPTFKPMSPNTGRNPGERPT